MSRTLRSAGAGQVFVGGSFYSAPVASSGFLWTVEATGKVLRIAPRPGGVPFVWAETGSNVAAFSRAVAAEADDGRTGSRVPLLLCGDQERIYTVSLLTRDVSVVYQAEPGCTLALNGSVSESVMYRSIGAIRGYYAVVVRGVAGPGLMIRSFESAKADYLLPLDGASFAGPVGSEAEGLFCLCTADVAYTVNPAKGEQNRYPLPRGFRPFLERPEGCHVAPGVTPLSISAAGSMLVGGTQNGQPGVLEIELLSGRETFHGLSPGSGISVVPGGMLLNRGDRMDAIGARVVQGRVGTLDAGMPVGQGSDWTAFFGGGERGSQSLTVLCGFPFDVAVNDAACHPDSCLGIDEVSDALVVSYLIRSGDRNGDSGAGLRLGVFPLNRS